LESENQKLQKDVQEKSARIAELERSSTEIESGVTSTPSSDA